MIVDKRYLVLDRVNDAIRPSEVGYPARKPVIQSKNSPSFLKLDDAKAFCKDQASKNPGESFFVAEIVYGAAVAPPAPVAPVLSEGNAAGHPLLGTTSAPVAGMTATEIGPTVDDSSDDEDNQ